MRSRYVAFTLGDIDYIEKTTDPSARETFDRNGTADWANHSEWLGLEIIKASEGQKGNSTAIVEFIARYKYDGQLREHHERSDFKKRGGQWYFLDGKIVQEPVRSAPKIGPNEPCSCGSGKKYKKCCGSVLQK